MRFKIVAVGICLLAAASSVALAQGTQELCLPQFVNGTFNGFKLDTTLVFFNQELGNVQPQFNFFDAQGQPMNVSLKSRLGTGDTVSSTNGGITPAEFGGRTISTFRTGGDGNFQNGFVLVTTPGRMQANALIRVMDADNAVVSDTTVFPTVLFQTGGLLVDATDNQATGLALVNTSTTANATLQLSLFREGQSQTLGTANLTLTPRTQTSKLINEFFPGLLNNDFGFVLITSDQPVCALALQLHGVRTNQLPIFNDALPAAAAAAAAAP